MTRTYATPTPGNYVSPAGVVRTRVTGNTRTKSYTCSADLMSFQYDYATGTIITMSAETYAARVPADFHEPYQDLTPQARLLTLQASDAAAGVRLEWSTARNEHMDGFNVYRQQPEGALALVGYEADIEMTSDDVLFAFTDANATSGENIYWLGARSCAGDEGRVGPLRAVHTAAAPATARLSLSAGPNPTRGALHFVLTLGEVAAARLDVFDVTGRRVATPQEGTLAAGAHTLDSEPSNTDGTRLATGVYFARLEALGRTTLVRLTVLDR